MASMTRTIRRKLRRQILIPQSAKAKVWLAERDRKEGIKNAD